MNQDDLSDMASSDKKQHGRPHEDIPEEEELDDDEAATPTAKTAHRSIHGNTDVSSVVEGFSDLISLSRENFWVSTY